MGFYEETGILILGSRLKRLSERFLSEVGKIYEKLNINFEPAWFPMVFLIHKKGPLSVTVISEELNVSQPAASQLVSTLNKKGIFILVPDAKDKRKKMVHFSSEGKKIVKKLIPVWETLEKSMFEIFCENDEDFHVVDSFNQLEIKLNKINFSDTVINKLETYSEDHT
ncbi:MAG: MarR family transcriptional regulator [Spirochaetaceae bacterium]|jgi:DNA-binding MarR family transcriptional regulator|nr:MarR family transcriptional regulator [Spirochaetaceae bacterium]